MQNTLYMRGGFSSRAETVERADHILAEVRGLNIGNPLAKGIRRPVWSVLSFPDTKQCQAILQETCAHIASVVPLDERMIGHGTQDCYQFVHIMEDGRLKHYAHHENYGDLSCGHDIQIGGHWDKGWGLFVTDAKSVTERRAAAQQGKVWEMPLEQLHAIVLPSQVVAILRQEFTQYRDLLKGYVEFAEELKRCYGLK